jgi:hypothetical protein
LTSGLLGRLYQFSDFLVDFFQRLMIRFEMYRFSILSLTGNNYSGVTFVRHELHADLRRDLEGKVRLLAHWRSLFEKLRVLGARP